MPEPLLDPADVASWRAWLTSNHAQARIVWLVFWKKHTGRRTLTYEEAVEEAVCFGWIDSIVKRLDESRYAQKFTPRTDTSTWSPTNRARLRRLLAQGRMTEAGLSRVAPEVLAALDTPAPSGPRIEPTLTGELEQTIRGDLRAWEGFQALPPSSRRLHVAWVMAARREDTRRRRLAEVMGLLAQGKRLGLK